MNLPYRDSQITEEQIKYKNSLCLKQRDGYDNFCVVALSLVMVLFAVILVSILSEDFMLTIKASVGVGLFMIPISFFAKYQIGFQNIETDRIKIVHK